MMRVLVLLALVTNVAALHVGIEKPASKAKVLVKGLKKGQNFNIMHIPKAAGNSFEKDSPKFRNSGEFHSCSFGGNVATLLRSPRSHVLSEYMHCKSSPDHRYAWHFISNTPFHDWVQSWLQSGEDGSEQTAKYCCYNPMNMQKRFITCKKNQTVETANEKLDKMFFTGILEFYQESQCLLHYKALGSMPEWCNCQDKEKWQSAQFTHAAHGSAPHSVRKLDKETLSLVDQLIADDQKIYDHAVKKFKADLAYVENVTGTKVLCEDRVNLFQSLSKSAWIAFEDKRMEDGGATSSIAYHNAEYSFEGGKCSSFNKK